MTPTVNRVSQREARVVANVMWMNSLVQMHLELQNEIEKVFIVFYLHLRFAIINLHLSNHPTLQGEKQELCRFKCKFRQIAQHEYWSAIENSFARE